MRNLPIPLGVCALVALVAGCRNDENTRSLSEPAPIVGMLAAIEIESGATAGEFVVTCLGGAKETKTKDEIIDNKVCQAAARSEIDPAAPPATINTAVTGAVRSTSSTASGSALTLHFAEASSVKRDTNDCSAEGASCVEGTDRCSVSAGAEFAVTAVAVAPMRSYDHIEVKPAASTKCALETAYVYFSHLKLDLKLAPGAKVGKYDATLGCLASNGCSYSAGGSLLVRKASLRGGSLAFSLAGEGDACLGSLGAQLCVDASSVDASSEPLKTIVGGQEN